MRKFKYIARLLVPTIVLGGLTYYADVVDGSGQLPIMVIFGVALLMGFLLPKGAWRWVVLIAWGVDLANISGHLIDASPIPEEHKLTVIRLLRDMIPALIGTYAGIYAHRYFYGGDDWSPDERAARTQELESYFKNLTEALEEGKRKASEESPPDIPVRPATPPKSLPVVQRQVPKIITPSKPPAVQKIGPGRMSDPIGNALSAEAFAQI